jgi:hypothetical protein
VLRFARERDNVHINSRTGMPEPRDAERLFDGLADQLSHSGLADIKRQIRQYVEPGRVGCFACSSVGFRTRSDAEFDYVDCSLVYLQDGRVRLAGPVAPLGIMEPLLFVHGYTRTRAGGDTPHIKERH